MRKWWVSFTKELLLLRRDRMALLLMFVMPVIFVLVITAIQNVALGRDHKLTVLLINHDNNPIWQQTLTNLSQQGQLNLLQKWQGRPLTENKAKQLVTAGKYQALLIVPPHAYSDYQRYTQQAATGKPQLDMPKLTLLFDPAISPLLKGIIEAQLQILASNLRAQALTQALNEVLGTSQPSETADNQWLKVSYSNQQSAPIKPNATQQNVPAWAIFGMFFIVVPIAGSFIRERELSVWVRTRIAPVSFLTILFGRIAAYILVNLCQLTLMLLLGLTAMPWLGMPALSLGPHFSLLLLIGVATAFAATSLGMLIGTYAKSYEQASTLGSIIVVIAAAIGGIMVPTYLMPPVLQQLSWLSPLHWSHNAMLSLLVRGVDWQTIAINVALLMGFSIILLGIALRHER